MRIRSRVSCSSQATIFVFSCLRINSNGISWNVCLFVFIVLPQTLDKKHRPAEISVRFGLVIISLNNMHLNVIYIYGIDT